MPIARPLAVLPLAIALVATTAAPCHAQACCKAEPPSPGGSTSFCLYELPGDEGGRRRWINLGIVQYVEAGRAEVRIGYGGGRFGSGYEVRIPVASAEEAVQQIDHMRKAAAACK